MRGWWLLREMRTVLGEKRAETSASLCVVLLTRDSFGLCYFYVICVFCHLVVLVRLSVPVQVIDWKDSSPK